MARLGGLARDVLRLSRKLLAAFRIGLFLFRRALVLRIAQRAARAFFGKYRSPVLPLSLPDLVPQSSCVHCATDDCRPPSRLCSRRLWPCIPAPPVAPCGPTIGPAYRLCRPSVTACLTLSQSFGLVFSAVAAMICPRIEPIASSARPIGRRCQRGEINFGRRQDKREGRTSFLKKRSKKLLSTWHRAKRSTALHGTNNQKSFCFFFFRKRRILSLALTFAP